MIRSFLLCLGLALAGGVRAAQVRLPSALRPRGSFPATGTPSD